ncbi:MAG: hypothetical protein AAFZ65_04210 [Planctomycetota bacterium]
MWISLLALLPLLAEDSTASYGTGFRRAADGQWLHAPDLSRLDAGGVRFDLAVLPASAAEAGRTGQFPCGPFWFERADADDYHSRLLRWWSLPGRHTILHATVDRSTAEAALAWADFVVPDLERLFGRRPRQPATVVLLRSNVQYNAFATTDPSTGAIPPESIGFSAFHHAFPCEQWLDAARGFDHPGAACAYWEESTEAGRAWGPFAVRHAAAQSFVEWLDPSPRTVAAYRADPSQPFDSHAFWGEKQLPLWLRYGAAMYSERFFLEPGASDPSWARRWSMQALDAAGGLGDLDRLFAFEVGQDAVASSQELLLEAGAAVCFLLDGGDPVVGAAHSHFLTVQREGGDLGTALAGIESALRERSAALEAFCRP